MLVIPGRDFDRMKEVPDMGGEQVILGISGASGFQYGVRALEMLRPLQVKVHLVMTQGAEQTRALETDCSKEDVMALADVVHSVDNLGASIASGSFRTVGMLIAPCSMRTLACIAHAMNDNLLTRAADVTLKERRRLVLMTRETPLTAAHLRNMQAVTEMGGIVMPPVPAFYLRPQSIDEMVTHSVGRALDLLGFHLPNLPRWQDQD